MENQSKKGTLITISLDEDGLILKDVIDRSDFIDSTANNHPVQSRIIHLTDDIFVLIYYDVKEDKGSSTVFLKLYEILENGNITYLDEFIDLPVKAPLPENYPNNIPQLINIDNDTIAVTYSDLNESGILYTLNVSSEDGFNVSSFLNYDVYCNEPSMILLDDDTIVIAYKRDNLIESAIFPINVSTDGYIYPALDREIFNVEYNQPIITKVDDDTILLSYRNIDYEGITMTIDISSDNVVVPTGYSFQISETKYNEEFYTDSFNYPDICYVRENIYGMVFTVIVDNLRVIF
jgi:hypothetical protein